MDKQNNIAISTETANLLMALKSIETARNHFYLATEAMRGTVEELTDHMTKEENTVFDTARDMIEKAIGDNIRTWAFSTGQNQAI